MMTLDVLARLPVQVMTPEAVRLRDFLQRVDANLLQSLTVVVYGSAAVSLYLADETDIPYAGFTDDIDVGYPHDITALQQAAPSVKPSLHFQASNFEMWLIHPDWKDACVNVSHLVGLQRIELWLLHPIDLILTKLERYHERDFEDCLRLTRRYVNAVGTFNHRLEEALDFAAGINAFNRARIRDVYMDLFDIED